MSEDVELREQNAALRQENQALLAQVADAKQTLEALVGGEVDAVTLDASVTPVLLHAAQEKLRRNQALLRAMFDSSLDAILLADDGGRYVDANPAACELFGMSREQLLGRTPVEFAAEGYDAEARYRSFQEQGRMRGMFPLQRPDGTRRSLEYSAVANVVPGLHLSILRDVTDRVRTEEALHQYRRMLEEAQAIAHIGSWTWGTRGGELHAPAPPQAKDDEFIWWSPECYHLYGIPPGTAVTVEGFYEPVHPDDRERVARQTSDALAQGLPYDVEHRVVLPDGQVRWLQVRGVVERDSTGRPTRMMGTAQDITQRRLAIEALRESEAEFRLLAEAMPQIVWIAFPEGGNAFLNQRWMDYTGLSPEESLGDGWLKPFHPEDRELAREAWQAAIATIGTYSLECRLRRADGVYRWWLIRGEPVRDGDGNVRKWFGTCTDIETLKQSEASLRASEALLRIAGHVARLGAWSLALPNLELTWSDEVCAIHEVPIGTVPTLEQALSYYAPEFREQMKNAFERGMRDGTPFDIELQIVTTSQRRVWVRAIASAERNASGAITAIRGAFQDIDDQRRLQEQLLQSQKMEAMGQLAGGVAHDFNNILAVILSYGAFIRDALPPGDERRGDIIEVIKAADRAADLTRQLLAFTRQQHTQKRPTDLNLRLTQLHKLLIRTLGEHITLSVVPSARPAVVRIDPVQFDQIVLNLAVNARDAMPHGGQLLIVLEHVVEANPEPGDLGSIHLKVTDTGTGMDSVTQERAFEPFFTTKERGRGTGLGLATCFGIVTEAGGKIHLRSAPGQGSTFTVELPVCGDKPHAVVGESVRPPRNGQGEIVLLVEDDAALRRVAARVLTSAGYTVHVATDGTDAKKQLDELGHRLDVLVSDVVMPGCSGYDLVAHARRTAPTAAVLLTSGFAEEAAVRDPGDRVPILWKPVPPQDLMRAVAEALQGRAEGASVPAGHVLLIEDDDAVSKMLVRVLERAGYVARAVATLADARQALELGPEPQMVLCDLTLPDGSSAGLLDWIQEHRPSLCTRVLVLTGGAVDDAGKRVTNSGTFRVLSKPIQPKHLLEVLAEMGLPAPAVPALPAKPTKPTSSAQPPAPSARGGAALRTERVLIVEDDDSLAGSSQRILGDVFEVLVVGTVAAARTALREEELDAVVLDIGLPDGSGLDLLRELRGKNAELPVVMMTGALSTEAAMRVIQSRVSDYLPKPFAAEELLRVVRRAVDSGRVSRLRTKLLASRFGGDEFVNDLARTERIFALALSKIRMVFQPIVRSADGSVFGYEALLRCDEPSLASPLRLLAAAEVLGRVDEVGRVVRASVAEAMLSQPDRLETIFVNLHPSEVRGDLLAEATDPLLSVAHRVVLEITERASLEGGPKLNAELAQIRQLGYRLAVDDLGEGYAGLSSLVHLRPDITKIDMSLVRDIHRMPLQRDIVAALVDMARRSRILVIAEGIETIEERDTLVDLGCDLLQGYLFAKPGPAFPVPRTTFERIDGAAVHPRRLYEP